MSAREPSRDHRGDRDGPDPAGGLEWPGLQPRAARRRARAPRDQSAGGRRARRHDPARVVRASAHHVRLRARLQPAQHRQHDLGHPDPDHEDQPDAQREHHGRELHDEPHLVRGGDHPAARGGLQRQRGDRPGGLHADGLRRRSLLPHRTGHAGHDAGRHAGRLRHLAARPGCGGAAAPVARQAGRGRASRGHRAERAAREGPGGLHRRADRDRERCRAHVPRGVERRHRADRHAAARGAERAGLPRGADGRPPLPRVHRDRRAGPADQARGRRLTRPGDRARDVRVRQPPPGPVHALHALLPGWRPRRPRERRGVRPAAHRHALSPPGAAAPTRLPAPRSPPRPTARGLHAPIRSRSLLRSRRTPPTTAPAPRRI